MDSAWLVPLSLALGILVGAGFVITFVVASHRGHRAVQVATPTVPEGVDEIIDVLESVGIVVDPSNNVIKASVGAITAGLVRNQALVHPEIVEMVDAARRQGTVSTRELNLPRGPLAEPTVAWEVRVARLGARYVLVLAADRTEAHRLDEVRRDFVANISHELKTPIGAVSLLAEALQSASSDPEQVRRFASRLSEESERLSRITHEIIELSRLQSGDALVTPVEVSIDHVVAVAVDQNRVAADAHRITLVAGGDTGAVVLGDETRLVMALNNLISNAVQYSPDASRIGVGVRRSDGVVEIAVTDQGVGLAPEEIDRVFERFFRVDPARSRHSGGTGLGLSIVKHVVQNHGGEVRVWSQLGHGSTFTIRLPEYTDGQLQGAIA